MIEHPLDGSTDAEYLWLVRLNQLCDEFESAFHRGSKPVIEEVLREVAQDQRAELLAELLPLEIEYRRSNGENPQLGEYLARVPEYSAVVAAAFRRSESSTETPGKNGETGPDVATRYARRLKLRRVSVLPANTRIGDFELLEEVGRGGMGVVYKARQISLERVVAVKMILSGEFADRHEIARFQAEAKAAASLKHPTIVPIYKVGEEAGRHYLVMEYIDGQSLTEIQGLGPMPPHDAARLIATVADAVQYAHSRGIVHRDLKPGNILLDRAGQPNITDFGLARRYEVGSDLTPTGQLLGTPSFIPPEQAVNDAETIGPTSDVYSLGALLYTLLTGRPPFQAASFIETLNQVLDQEPVSPRQLNPAVPRDLETICLKCLEKTAQQRCGSAAELAEQLRRFLRHEPILYRPVGPVTTTWRWCRRRPAVAALLLAALGGVLALAAIVFQSMKLQATRQAGIDLQYGRDVSLAMVELRRKQIGGLSKAKGLLVSAASLPSSIRDPSELRNLFAACLTGFDLKYQTSFCEGLALQGFAFNHDGSMFAACHPDATDGVYLELCSLTERKVLRRLSTPGDSWWVKQLGAPDGARCLAFSPDGSLLAVGTRSGLIHVWDLPSGSDTPAMTVAPPRGERADRLADKAVNVAFSPDGRSLFAHHRNVLRAWSLIGDSPPLLRAYSGEPPLSAFCALTDKPLLAVITDGLHLVDATTFEMQPLLRPLEKGPGRALYASHDGNTLALVRHDKVTLLDTITGNTLRELVDPEDRQPGQETIDTVDFHPDDTLLSTTGSDKRLKIWEIATGRLLLTQFQASTSRVIARFSPDGEYLAVTGPRGLEVHALTPRAVQTLVAAEPRPIAAIDVTGDGETLVCFTEQPDGQRKIVENTLTQWDVKNHKIRARRAIAEPWVDVSKSDPPRVSCDTMGKFIAYTGRYSQMGLVESGPLWAMPAHDALVADPARTSRFVVEESELKLLESDRICQQADEGARNGRCVRLLANGSAAFEVNIRENVKLHTEVAYFRVFVRLRADHSIGEQTICRIEILKGTGERAWVTENLLTSAHVPDDRYHWYYIDYLPWHRGNDLPYDILRIRLANIRELGDLFVDAMAFIDASSHGGSLVALSPRGERIWTVSHETQIVSSTVPAQWIASHFDNAKAVGPNSPTGISALAAGDQWALVGSNDNVPRLLRASNAALERSWPPSSENDSIRALAFSHDESLAAIGTLSGHVRVVIVPSGDAVADLAGHSEKVTSVVFNRDASLLVTASEDRTVRLWQRCGAAYELALTLPSESGPVDCVRFADADRQLFMLVRGESAVRMLRLDMLQMELSKVGLGWQHEN
jgi:serine/threonine-protein kinase